MLGIIRSGNAFVPLDPALPDERLVFMLSDCGTTVLVTEARHRERAERLAERTASVHTLLCSEDDSAVEPPGDAAGDPDRGCYVIYTSGSTGTPKGVVVNHRDLVPLLAWSIGYFPLGPGTTVAQNLNHALDFGV